jgi:hypothetical protein
MKKRFIKNGRKGKQEKTCEGPDRHEPSPRFLPLLFLLIHHLVCV